MDAVDFLDNYEPKPSELSMEEQSEQCDILNSQDEPVVVAGELQ
ncbi:TPA: hypothetical protein ACP4R5_004403 [Klebsiella pneumoniae]